MLRGHHWCMLFGRRDATENPTISFLVKCLQELGLCCNLDDASLPVKRRQWK